MWRGGMLIIRLSISPRLTASKCSQMASMCQPCTYSVAGSTTCHAWRTYSTRLRCASSVLIADRFKNGSQLAELVCRKFAVVNFMPGLNLHRPLVRPGHLVFHRRIQTKQLGAALHNA